MECWSEFTKIFLGVVAIGGVCVFILSFLLMSHMRLGY